MKVGTNSLALPFPQDQEGSLYDIKRGGIASANRIRGNEKRLEKYLKTLEILGQYAKERFDVDLKARENSKGDAANAALRIAERDARNAERKVKELTAQLDKAKASPLLAKVAKVKQEDKLAAVLGQGGAA